MKAKKYLQEIRRLEDAIGRNQEEKEILYAKLTGRAISYEGERVQRSGAGEPMIDVMAKVIELDHEISQQTASYVTLLHEIKGQIEQLCNDTFTKLLFKRYVEGKSLEVISVEMNYTYQHVRRTHGFALQAFEKQFAGKIAEYERRYTMIHSDVV